MYQNKPRKGRPNNYERTEGFNEVTKLLEQDLKSKILLI